MKYKGHLEISTANYKQFMQLEEVTGDLTIRIEHGALGQVAPVVVKLSMLASLTGSLVIHANVEVPELVSVKGRLVIADAATRLCRINCRVEYSSMLNIFRAMM